MFSNNLGDEKVPLLSIWKGVHIGDRLEAISLNIYRKHMVEISPRIQRLIIRSFPYQPFDVQYRKGVEIPLADTLSRVTPDTSGTGWNSTSNSGS